MFRFLKNIFNLIIIFLAIVGIFTLYKNYKPAIIDNLSNNLFSLNKEEIRDDVGDFSKVNEEFKIDKAVNVLGYKTVVAKHENSGQKMIIIDSGKKAILKESDLNEEIIKEKMNEMIKKIKHDNTDVENIKITKRGYMKAYGEPVQYVKFNAKISNIPNGEISGIISVVDSDTNKQKLIISINDNKHYSQLITTEFYKNVYKTKNR